MCPILDRQEYTRDGGQQDPKKSRLWSINGRFLGRPMTGVDRYAFEILKAIDSLIGDGHPLAAGLKLEILCPTGAVEVSPFVNIGLRLLPSAPGHIWEQFILPGFVTGGLLSLCNTGPVSVRKQIACIHDVNSRIAPESYSLPFRTLYRLLHPALGRRAAQIVTVSEFSKNELIRFGIAPTNRITVIHDGYEHVLGWNAGRSSLRGKGLPNPFVLLVGSKAPHKNVAIIYSIAAELAAHGIHLLVTGGQNTSVYAAEKTGELPPTVKHLGRVSDDDLAFLYQNALCLAFPSRTEGFGLPALEAMAFGCPVVSTTAASLPEVCGDAAIYSAPDDAAGWLSAIVRLASDPVLRKRLKEDGLNRATQFLWRAGGGKYLELMRRHGKNSQVVEGYLSKCGSAQSDLLATDTSVASSPPPSTVRKS